MVSPGIEPLSVLSNDRLLLLQLGISGWATRYKRNIAKYFRMHDPFYITKKLSVFSIEGPYSLNIPKVIFQGTHRGEGTAGIILTKCSSWEAGTKYPFQKQNCLQGRKASKYVTILLILRF